MPKYFFVRKVSGGDQMDSSKQRSINDQEPPSPPGPSQALFVRRKYYECIRIETRRTQSITR